MPRVRMDGVLRAGIEKAARASGINPSAWRKLAYSKALNDELGPNWRKELGARQESAVEAAVGVGNCLGCGADTLVCDCWSGPTLP